MRANSAKSKVLVRCSECPIRHRAVCSVCDAEELAHLDAVKTYRTYKAGEAIAWSGEALPLLGSVVSGVAMLSRTLPDGRRQMVGLLLPSDFLGRPGREESPFDVVAATEVTFCMFSRPEFERIIENSPQVGRRLLEMTLDELDSAREWMLLLGRKTAREKIASLFVIMARRNSELLQEPTVDGLRFPLYITREAMSDYLGLTIETVSRQISALRQDKLIELEGGRMVRVPDFAGLLDAAGDDSDGMMLS